MTVERLLRNKKKEFITVSPARPVQEAVALMARNDVGALIVSENGLSIDGIVSERDIVRGLDLSGADILNRSVDDLMTRNVVTCHANDSMTKVMALMASHRIRHLPVVHGDILCGLVSIRDIIDFQLNEVQQEAEDMRQYLAAV